MSDTSTATLTDADRDRVFGAWLKPIKPAKSHKETVPEKLTPWRHQFVGAIAAGYTWEQLATEVATKPEIGMKISAKHLKNSIYAAFKAAGETMPGQTKAKRRHARTRPAPLAPDIASPAVATK
jgi:hypothetical protein